MNNKFKVGDKVQLTRWAKEDEAYKSFRNRVLTVDRVANVSGDFEYRILELGVSIYEFELEAA